ncbi:MAG TPA: hypothetical protein LFV92_03425 [Rickettsia endosymbiont of Ceroptres masudai]|nr:hypothetical protein [Rickettsia endosymbiont of Ceroptres masudai]
MRIPPRHCEQAFFYIIFSILVVLLDTVVKTRYDTERIFGSTRATPCEQP